MTGIIWVSNSDQVGEGEVFVPDFDRPERRSNPDESPRRTTAPGAKRPNTTLQTQYPDATRNALKSSQDSVIEFMSNAAISRSKDVMGGTAVFRGTRVPVQTLLDCLEAGDSIDEFLEGFPTVTRELAIEFLEQAKDRLVDSADSVT